MIRSFRHRGLERFFLHGDKSGIRPEHATRIQESLGLLAAAMSPTEMNVPGLRFHRLKGNPNGRWSVSVSGNWRITFAFAFRNAVDVDYEDYH